MTMDGKPRKYDQSFTPTFKEGLRQLNRKEQKYLADLITPEAAFLLTKAFGPDMGVMLWPFIVDDEVKNLEL